MGLEKIGKGVNEGEQAEVTGYFSAGRGYKRRGCLKVTEAVLF